MMQDQGEKGVPLMTSFIDPHNLCQREIALTPCGVRLTAFRRFPEPVHTGHFFQRFHAIRDYLVTMRACPAGGHRSTEPPRRLL
jgi:hypothetical protein